MRVPEGRAAKGSLSTLIETKSIAVMNGVSVRRSGV